MAESDPATVADKDLDAVKAERIEYLDDEPIPYDDVSYGSGGMRGLWQSPYVVAAAFLASLGGFSFGYDQGVISIINTMEQFHEQFPRAATPFGKGFMTGMLEFGAFVGALAFPYLADRISRKRALSVVTVVFNVGAIMQTAAPDYGTLVAGRTIGGIGVGTLALVDDCLKSLSQLRPLPAEDSRVQAEFTGIMTGVRFQNIVQERRHPGVTGIKREMWSWLDLFRKEIWRRLVVGVGVAFFQQFSGINAFIYYAPTLFESLGQTPEMALILSGVFNCLQLVAVAVCFVVIDHVGRRPLAIWGGFGCCICYIIIAALSSVYEDDWSQNSAAGWACVAMAFMFILIYGVSYSPLGWALPPEVFPNSMRSKGVAMSVATIWLCNFIIGVATPPMLDSLGYGTYIFFAAWCGLAGVWAFLERGQRSWSASPTVAQSASVACQHAVVARRPRRLRPLSG
ncbi:hypothetical protein CBER1_04701 [Cercospora berteroae]|uniref:Major facilitator superfamily (MFS) profile domain-containing protein n=1 Tax=Cercospora berteroae TaxID=357750 RepID=A0A2S6BR71_9PEZI|nr:hypothetical protein CBER1_04701 [Cercospora berteroae]